MSEPPTTGNRAIDDACAQLDLDVELVEHHDRLAAYHRVLAAAPAVPGRPTLPTAPRAAHVADGRPVPGPAQG